MMFTYGKSNFQVQASRGATGRQVTGLGLGWVLTLSLAVTNWEERPCLPISCVD